MLSYQHGFHAGHFADVHKHAALCLILDHLRRKPTPFCVLDTHAGRGRYDLGGEQAAKTGEWRDGIGRLWNAVPKSRALALYLDTVRAFNEDDAAQPAVYPGSPLIALHGMRSQDRLVALELHPAEHAALKHTLKGYASAHVHRRDGFEGLPALVPPKERRGLVLMDPSYEIKDDYAAVPVAVAKGLKRWPRGIYAAWYPLLPEGRHGVLIEDFAAIAGEGFPVLVAELVGPARPRGLYGTGLAVVNPPHGFESALAEAGTEMAALLFAGKGRHIQRMLDGRAG